jgi:uncharacterized membrane protein YdbT with pleckstrin-like domain
MRENGFRLRQKPIIMQTRPSTVGLFFHTFGGGKIAQFVFLFFFLFISSISSFIAEVQSFGKIGFIVVGITLLFVAIEVIIRLADFRKRVYTITSDTILFTDGYFNLHESFIPLENVSDITLHKSFLGRIVNVSDLNISCQGSQQEIIFEGLSNGEKLHEEVMHLMDKRQVRIEKQTPNVQKQKQIIQTKPVVAAKKIKRQTIPKEEFGMNAKRAYATLWFALPFCVVLFPLIPLWMLAFIAQAIRVSITKYSFKEGGVRENIDFFMQQQREFSFDKITGIKFKENFIDRKHNTWTIEFISIGSATPITFEYIPKNEQLREQLLNQLDITANEKFYEIDAAYSVSNFFASNVLLSIILFAVISASIFFTATFSPFAVIAAIIAGVALLILMLSDYYHFKYAKIQYYADCVRAYKGKWFYSDFYARYDDVKDTKTKQYVGTYCGTIYFNIAGERIIKSNQNQQQLTSEGIPFRYIPDAWFHQDLFDAIATQRPDKQSFASIKKELEEKEPVALKQTRPNLGNSVLPLVLVSIILAPLLVLLPLTLGLRIWWLRSCSYTLEKSRVVKRSGIFYRRQKSVSYHKIDHVNTRQGVLNQMFSNAKLTINTAGSSAPELQLQSLKPYKEWYSFLKEQ